MLYTIKLYVIIFVMLANHNAEIKIWILGGTVSTLLTILILIVRGHFNKKANFLKNLDEKLNNLNENLNDLKIKENEKRVKLKEMEKRIEENKSDIYDIRQRIRKQ